MSAQPQDDFDKNQKPEPMTGDLLETLLTEPNTEEFLNSYGGVEFDLAAYLNQLLTDKNLRKSDVIKKSGLNETFAYQIFSGSRKASRDKVLQLAFAMELLLPEVQRLLEHAGVNRLYCKNRRDAIIIICISNKYSFMQTEQELYSHDERTITASDNT